MGKCNPRTPGGGLQTRRGKHLRSSRSRSCHGCRSCYSRAFLVARFGEWMAHKTYAFISDGGIQEEISQGAGRIAGTLGLSNLIMFYDANEVQLSTRVNEVTHEDTAAKYQAWGWNVITINGTTLTRSSKHYKPPMPKKNVRH